MTLAEYNARRRELTRLDVMGQINYIRNGLLAFAQYIASVGAVPDVTKQAARLRRLRLKHKFWECW